MCRNYVRQFYSVKIKSNYFCHEFGTFVLLCFYTFILSQTLFIARPFKFTHLRNYCHFKGILFSYKVIYDNGKISTKNLRKSRVNIFENKNIALICRICH